MNMTTSRTSIFKALAMAAAVAGIAACASTPDVGNDTVTTTQTTAPVETVVAPQATEVLPQGPVPGSQADLDQNAGNMVFFGYDQYNLTQDARDTLARQAAWLKEYPETRIRVAGNCDERGTREYNLALGARRANAARAYLTSLGVDGSRITTISYGKERPIDARSTPEGWARNRNAATMLVMAGS